MRGFVSEDKNWECDELALAVLRRDEDEGFFMDRPSPRSNAGARSPTVYPSPAYQQQDRF